MRFARPFTALLSLALVASLGSPAAWAQSVDDARGAAEEARQAADAADGLVGDAVANREELELQLADSITRMNELAEQLSLVGADLDRVAAQVGYADVELAGIKADIEHQAVDAYMTVVASPSVSVVNTSTVEKALVASSVVEDVVADGRTTVGELSEKRESLEGLKDTFLADQDEYLDLQEQVDAEVANYAALYEQAEADVAEAVRQAQTAEQEYLAALSAVEVAQAKDEERQRQDHRQGTGSTTSTSPPTTSGSGPTTTQPSSPTTNAPPTTTPPTGGGGGGPWNHPPQVEQWRGLVSQYFPAGRVEEALAIIDCESNGDPNARNPYSGASGLFQFLPSTWATTAPKAGFSGASVFDPAANIGSAAWLGNRYEDLGYYFWQPWSCKRVLN